ncbi:unnamed protein product, partial [Didymodactylos carnosus]
IKAGGLCTDTYGTPTFLESFGAGKSEYSSATPASLGFTTTYTDQ